MMQLSPGQSTPERMAFNAALANFELGLPSGSIVGDVGKSQKWSYKELFYRHKYSTIDRDQSVEPNVVLDLESGHEVNARRYEFDALICNGVTEQCDDPFELIRGCRTVCKTGARTLWGIAAPGYPLYGERDRFRFTDHGAVHALSKCGFDVREVHYRLKRQDVLSYMALTCVAR